MEESCVHEEDKVHGENSKKRTLKTPAQVEALERLYNEHKYPTESLKAQLAEEIGLSEKQVSGWFCHRRLKDKNMLKDEAHGIGRQDLSSGIIQDRGSALKQDSCSSTKPGEYKHFDPREVESRRFCGQSSPIEDLAYRNMAHSMRARNQNTMDNTSSGSSSASQERMSPPSKDRYDMEPLRFSSRSTNYTLMNMKDDLKPREHMMETEFLNPQDEIESAAILAVKRQLGRHYRDDGPTLGVRFETLPPSAFDEPIEDVTNGSGPRPGPGPGPYYVGDPILPKSVGVLKVHKEPTYIAVGGPTEQKKEKTQSKRRVRPHSSHPEGDLNQIRLEPDHRNDCNSYQFSKKSSITNGRSYGPGQYTSVESTDEHPAGMAGSYNKSRDHRIMPLHGTEGMKSKPIRNNFVHPNDTKVITTASSYPMLYNHENSRSHTLQKGQFIKHKPSMILQNKECFGTEHREHYRMAKLDEEQLYRVKKKSEENASLARVNMQLNNDIRRKKTKRSDKYPPLDYASKTPSPRASLPWENQMKGYPGEVPTSFSDDETAATSSSVD